jgi:predicted glycosyltransferase/peptidoglycan/xylan/chitin deacetylase (PgdA/CDA1 family)
MSHKLQHRCYYALKPLLPKRLRYAIRRIDARRKRVRLANSWPILPGSELPPLNWPGWPEGRQFAFVLTHDVEGQKGLDRCRQLMELETRHGFRSSFNFVPEGEYRVDRAFREEIVHHGFEVGVHDLHHDGSLFRDYEQFTAQSARVNEYLKEWNAVGFRAGFMFHNLKWQHLLNIRYDLSTFDADPFEPQPDGMGTIFPFWVDQEDRKGGYMELPYTLVQDSTLFLFLEEKGIAVWKQKLDWVAEHGGMALLNAHPDYFNLDPSGRSCFEFPSALYEELLGYVRTKYEGKYWHALPRELADYCARFKPKRPILATTSPDMIHQSNQKPVATLASTILNGTPRVKIWIDLDNTPHVPLFIPIIRELERRGHKVMVTARDAFQVCELAQQKGLSCVKVGRHYGKNPMMKVLGLLWRSCQLAPDCLRERPQLALSHGSRSKELLGRVMGIPTVSMNDYEHSSMVPLALPRWCIVPDAISVEESGGAPGRVRQYRGIKEDVYAPDFKPDESLLDELGLRGAKLVVTVRPPATEAHYHNPEAEALMTELMARVCQTGGARAVLLPRNRSQEADLCVRHPEWFADGRTIVPSRAVDGMNLLWFSDLVVSGGGTMNREAAALGIPVYSIFRGKTGAVDRKLEQEGRLIMIRSVEEVRTRISLLPRDRRHGPDSRPRHALQDIVDHVEDIIRIECAAKQGRQR